jgi:hypothetical protein
MLFTGLTGEVATAIEDAQLMLDEGDLSAIDMRFLAASLSLIAITTTIEKKITAPHDWTLGGLISGIAAAAAGKEEALMRLPAEVADIVREARAQNAQRASASP